MACSQLEKGTFRDQRLLDSDFRPLLTMDVVPEGRRLSDHPRPLAQPSHFRHPAVRPSVDSRDNVTDDDLDLVDSTGDLELRVPSSLRRDVHRVDPDSRTSFGARKRP